MKAYSIVCAENPDLRSSYVPFSWPHLYLDEDNVCFLTISREYQDETRLFFSRFNTPENKPLLHLQQQFETYRNAPPETAEIMAYEDLGFCARGEGGSFIEEKHSYIGGDVAVNVDGGLKAKGHPIGATGVSMAYEIVTQLRGDAGERQVPDAGVGLTHNVGGIGQYTFVNLFRRD